MQSVMPYILISSALFDLGTALSCRNPGDRWISHGLSGAQKGKLLGVHNALRNKVASGGARGQPPAQNMREMVWDNTLAQIAQKWADLCVFEHDSHRKYPGRGDSFGQNLYISMSRGTADDHNVTEVNWKVEDGAYSWYNEVRGYKYQAVTAGNFARAGHYTQEVWANTNRVGCGFTVFQSGGWKKRYLVCNYYQAGNMIGQFPYVSGSPNCGRYRMAASRSYKSLCT
uniref:Venom allergen 3 n=1 Tax=Lygus hesperus TaxID=30085 RepID=A0A146MDA6_LYGHE